MNKDTDKLELLNHSISITERQNIQIIGKVLFVRKDFV